MPDASARDPTWAGHDFPADPELTDPEVLHIQAETDERRYRILSRAILESDLPPFRRYVAEEVFFCCRTQLFIDFLMDVTGEKDMRVVKRQFRKHLAETARVLKPIVRRILAETPE